jgi:hypothetical protein
MAICVHYGGPWNGKCWYTYIMDIWYISPHLVYFLVVL